MTKELADRLIGNIRRATFRALRVTDELSLVGGKIIAGPEWGRDGQARRQLEAQAKELRDLAGYVQCTADMIDESNEQKGAA